MKQGYTTYLFSAKRGLALLFLMLFLNGFVIETFAYHWNESCQTEVVDFEGEKDTEEDSKDEKEKENKILESSELSTALNQNLPAQEFHHIRVGNEEAHEVLSPPPDAC